MIRANPRPAEEFRFHIETLGCPKNKVDSRRMRSALLRAGFREGSNAEASDIILINSCSFIREAQEETIETVFGALNLRSGTDKKVGLIGCFAERFADAVREDLPELDFTVGTGKFDQIPGLLSERFNITLTGHEGGNWSAGLNAGEETPHAWFRIARGCSRKCAFCIIPTIRGPLNKFDFTELEKQFEEETAMRREVPLREAVLVSQDTISQGVDELEEIIAWFSEKPDLHWIRLQYLFPDVRVLKLLDLFPKYPKLTPYLDIPFQHAHPSVLKRMNRPHDPGLFREIISKAREVRPGTEIRTSFIVGFPGETEEEFTALKDFIAENPVHKLALFRYSHETGTPAGDAMRDDIAEETKIERINVLRNFHLEQRKGMREALKGSVETMLVDRINGKELEVRRAQDAPEIDEVVFVPVPAGSGHKPGDMVRVELEMPLEYDWFGGLRE